MNIDFLVQALSQDVQPVSTRGLWKYMALMNCAAVAASIALTAVALGFRTEVIAAGWASPVWMKWVYTLPLCALAVHSTWRMAIPGATRTRVAWLAAPLFPLVAVATIELAAAPVSQWPVLGLGHSWSTCPMWVAVLSVPMFAATCAALRRMAPVQLRRAGALAGLAAGACAATIYALACDEASAVFVLIWYSLGIACAAGLGAIVGQVVLRW